MASVELGDVRTVVIVPMLKEDELIGGISIFRRRHQFFDRDPDVDNDVPVVRRNREEAIMFVWGGLTLVLLYVLDQVWSA